MPEFQGTSGNVYDNGVRRILLVVIISHSSSRWKSSVSTRCSDRLCRGVEWAGWSRGRIRCLKVGLV
jgi:hypothetical protein